MFDSGTSDNHLLRSPWLAAPRPRIGFSIRTSYPCARHVTPEHRANTSTPASLASQSPKRCHRYSFCDEELLDGADYLIG
eukprot:4032919-Heterocapsa_arctica.AAC.1